MTQAVDRALTLRKTDFGDDWYIIEWAEHDGREWIEWGSGGGSFRRSARVSDADVEGTLAEMVVIAQAIKDRSVTTFRRCAVDARDARVMFWSPRNSTSAESVSLAVAVALAVEIQRVAEGNTDAL